MQNSPAKTLPKILKTLLADPMILIFGAIADMENVRQILNHKLARTKRAMVVIPIGALLITAIITMQQSDALQIPLLSLQPPI